MECNERIIAPSLLAADWSRVGEELARAERCGADWCHLDVMDGHFVDNISFGPNMVRTVRGETGQYLDVHLMIHRADHYLDRFLDAGADGITVHLEAEYDSSLRETLARVREAGKAPGLAINPATPISEAEPYLDEVDLLLVMTVVPGFGGQSFMEEETMPKLERARALREERGLDFRLEVDGGIDTETAPVAVAHGADVLVAGTALYRAPDMAAAVAAMRGA